MQLTRKKLFKYGLSAVLITGVILALGFLSFTGMLALCGMVGFAIGSFAVTAMIEGEVYAQNILRGIEKLLKGKWFENKYLKNKIYLLELNNLLKNEGIFQQYTFLQRYSEHLKVLEKLRAKKEKLGFFFYHFLYYFLDENLKQKLDELEQKLERAERIVEEQQKQFIALMENNAQKNEQEKDKFLSDLQEAISLNLAKKQAISPWCLATGVLAGVGMGLVFFSVAPESIVATAAFFGITLSASAFPIGITITVITLSLMAAVGYAVLVYNTLTDMLHNEAVENWIKGIKEFFSPQGEKITPVGWRIVGALGVALLVGLCIFATITTAGTWWYAAKAGATFILPQLERLVAWVSTPLVIMMGIGQLGFNLYNSLKTVSIIKNLNVERVKKKFSRLIKKYLGDQKDENTVQRFNGFRWVILLIAIPFEVLVFLGHVISSAVMGDRFEPVPPIASVIPATITEATSDLPTFVDDHHASSEPDKKMDGELGKTEKPHVHAGGEHDHSHTDIPGKVLFVILSPICFLSALWDFAASQSNEAPLKKLSFGEALIKSFFGFDTYKTLSKLEDMKGIEMDDNVLKELSVGKILRKLNKNNNELEKLGLKKEEIASFQELVNNLQKGESYENIFENAKKDNRFQSESARVFLARVAFSSVH